MQKDYSALSGLDDSEFRARITSCFDRGNATKSDAEDLNKIEKFLGLRNGILKDEEFYVSKENCQNCRRTFTFYDHVYGSVKDAGHSKSFVAHTLLGDKYFIQPPRPVRCSACDTVSTALLNYETPRYGCCN